MEEEKLDKRLIEIETIIAHQQKMLDDINHVLLEQNKIIDRLLKQNKYLSELIENNSVVKPLNEETPPPHY